MLVCRFKIALRQPETLCLFSFFSLQHFSVMSWSLLTSDMHVCWTEVGELVYNLSSKAHSQKIWKICI